MRTSSLLLSSAVLVLASDAIAQAQDAAIGAEPPMRLVAVSPDKFMTQDGMVTMEFNHGSFSDDMVMRYVEPRLGQVVTLGSQLAQR